MHKNNTIEFLIQHIEEPDSCCVLYTLCNALRFLGKHSPEPGTEEWSNLIKIAGCKYGSVIHTNIVAKFLGLVLKKIDPNLSIDQAPVMLTVWNPNIGSALHSVLVIGGESGIANLVNYRCNQGPIIENIEWGKIKIPPIGNINRRAWKIRIHKT